MKKLLLVCLVFVFSNSFYAQETATTKPKTKAAIEKANKAREKTEAKKEAEKKAKADDEKP